jgi:hypothetical protein
VPAASAALRAIIDEAFGYEGAATPGTEIREPKPWKSTASSNA